MSMSTPTSIAINTPIAITNPTGPPPIIKHVNTSPQSVDKNGRIQT